MHITAIGHAWRRDNATPCRDSGGGDVVTILLSRRTSRFVAIFRRLGVISCEGVVIVAVVYLYEAVRKKKNKKTSAQSSTR